MSLLVLISFRSRISRLMKRLFLTVLILCAAVQSWCQGNDSLKGVQYYSSGRMAFRRADYAAALSELTTFRTLNKASFWSGYAFASSKLEQTINLCLDEVGDAGPHINAPRKVDSVTRYRLALPPAELLGPLGNSSDSGNSVSQFVSDSSARYFYLGLIARKTKAEGLALTHFERSLSLDSSNGAAALELAISRGLITKAVSGQTVTFSDAAQSLAKKDSQLIISAYLGLADKNLFERKYAEAWRYYEKAARIDAQSLEAQTGIAEACLKMNRTAPALKALEAIALIRPEDYENQWKLVRMYYNYGQYDKVLAMVPALRTKVADSKGWAFMLGKAYQARQNHGKAIELMQQASKDEPENSEAPFLIARMLVQMENYGQAIIYYRQALRIDSVSQPGRIYELALALSTDRQYSESVACFRKALEKGYRPGPDYYKNLTNTLADANQPDEAVRIVTAMLLVRPTDVALINALGDVYYNNGSYREAISTWDRLMTSEDKNARTLFKVGLANIKMGKGKEGRALCRQAIAIDSSLAPLMQAQED